MKLLNFITFLTLSVSLLGIPLRLAFTQTFVKFLYYWGNYPKEYLPLALLGLRAVLSEEGLREFSSSPYFNRREVKHMNDVRLRLKFFFWLLYPSTLWSFLYFLIFRKKFYKVAIFSSIFVLIFTTFCIIFSIINYDLAFELFHNFVFDPYSWRFPEGSYLLKAYPMDFWFRATLLVLLLFLLLSLSLLAFSFLRLRR